MGATSFATFGLGKTPSEAFNQVVQEARYWHGHRGYTGTVAEKDGFVFAGEVSSLHLDRLEDYFWMASHRAVSKIPDSIKPTIKEYVSSYDDKSAPAVCFEVTGTKKKEIKEARGRKGSHDKVYVFLGMASS